MAAMGQVEMRAELARRGLVNYGNNHELRTRLEKDEEKGIFKGDFQTMSIQYLRDGCQLLSIPRTGDRQSLINNTRRYNAYKRRKIANLEPEGEINAGLPHPEDRLGAPTGVPILGTQGSSVYCKPYAKYLAEYERTNGSTKDALTFRFWRTLRYPNASADELWPCRYSDGRISASEDMDS